MQVSGNAITCAGRRAIAEAIAGNENTALAQLYGVELLDWAGEVSLYTFRH
jgi:hypothetical protein